MTVKPELRRPCFDFLCRRGAKGEALVFFRPAGRKFFHAIPWQSYHHSPDGPEWGYCGSGPADFALWILSWCLPIGCDGEDAFQLFRGACSPIAWRLHQDLKSKIIAGIPRQGGSVRGLQIDEWIDKALSALQDAVTVDEFIDNPFGDVS